MAKTVMCKNCNNYRNDWCEIVIDSPDPDMVRDCRHFWLKTNADRIRAMTDEELAKECVKQFPMYLWPTDVRTIYFDFDNHNKNNAINAWIKWLQQPAEGDA